MKTLLLALILSLGQVTLYADDTGSTTMSTEDKELRKLGVTICAMYLGAGDKIAQNVKKHILRYMQKFEGISDPTVPQIITFLNQNKNKILCENGTKSYMMAAFDHGAHEQLFRKLFINDFFKADKSVHIDINAVTPAGENGEPMTVLDYMDKELADPRSPEGYKKEVRSLRNMFAKYFGAKKFSELPESEKEKYVK